MDVTVYETSSAPKEPLPEQANSVSLVATGRNSGRYKVTSTTNK